MEAVIRASESEALAGWDVIEDRHGTRGRVGSDGSARGMNVGGPPELVADYIRQFADLGIGEVIWIFRSPFDLETMSRLHEVRALVG
jgi:alkanesulfonate monooxygenase SsuD/methylene tetrahydromethanopterin reductase-like flavin-dependent oxidoreductase (luciferase family)